MSYTSEERFKLILHDKLGDHYDRALTIFKNFGPELGSEMVNVLRMAAEKGRLDEVLLQLEEHWRSYLVHQPRGVTRHKTAIGGNPTDEMYMRIMRYTLDEKLPGPTA